MQTSRPPVPSVLPADDPSDLPVFDLPTRWSEEVQRALQAFLLTNRERSVRIGMREVYRADCLMVQFLIAAARAWAGRGLDVVLVDRTASFDEAMTLIGVTPAMLRGLA